jgi:hypothetical protein
VAELQLGSKGLTQVVELLDGLPMDLVLPILMMVVEQPTVQEIVHQLGHQVPRLLHTDSKTVLLPVQRHLAIVETIPGVLRLPLTNHNNISPITAGRINSQTTDGAAMHTMLPLQVHICLPLPLLL